MKLSYTVCCTVLAGTPSSVVREWINRAMAEHEPDSHAPRAQRELEMTYTVSQAVQPPVGAAKLTMHERDALKGTLAIHPKPYCWKSQTMLKLARKGVVEVKAAGFVLTAEGMAIARGLK
jgi:hypothetical protein